MDLMQKLTILADSAKYDVACTSSGSDRPGPGNAGSGKGMGSTVPAGCCHTFTADGRCVSLLKVLLTNVCVYDCSYCVNRVSNDVPRAAFTPEELSELTIQFYRRNYIEGLFLSSGVIHSPDHTMELMVRALELLRYRHDFWGYIHAKAIPGASPALLHRLGLVADRLSVNIELPSERSLQSLAPDKTRSAILKPMLQIAGHLENSRTEMVQYRHAKPFAPAGQSTQMIIGASPDSDYQIIRLASGLYQKYKLRRVFYSAYVPVADNPNLPSLLTKPPLLREHRLYQADFLLRQYRFSAEEILSEQHPTLNPYVDPKCNWALNHMEQFPVDVNSVPLERLLRVPGIGPKSAERIVIARKTGRLTTQGLKRIGVVLKRARFFILTEDMPAGFRLRRETMARALIDPAVFSFGAEQMSLFQENGLPSGLPQITDAPNVTSAVEGAIACLAQSL